MTIETLEQPATHIPPMPDVMTGERYSIAVVWDDASTDSETFRQLEEAENYYKATIKQSHVLFVVMVQIQETESTIIASYQSAKLKGH